MKKKNLIIFIIILLIYGFIMFLIFHNRVNNNTSKESKIIDNTTRYLVIDNVSNWSYINNSWKLVSTNAIDNSKQSYKVYQNNNYLGEYKLLYGNRWNLFNDNNEYVDYNGNIFAYSSNFDIRLIRFKEKEITEEDKSSITKDYNINNYDYLMNNQIISVDLDGNNELDQIIALSNIGEDYYDSKNFYNLISVKLNNKIYKIIDENKNNTDTLKISTYKINRIFNLNNDFYIVIEKIDGAESDMPSSTNYLYKFENDKFVKLIND